MDPADRNAIRQTRKAALTGTLAGWLIRAWSMTLRADIEDRAGVIRPTGPAGPVIYVLWHNRIFTAPPLWRNSAGNLRSVVVLTSASRDGATLAAAMAVLGFGAVRGSSSRRGAAALIALRRALRDGFDVCITPDGPRGPRYVVQPGVIKLASATGAPIVPIHIRFSSAWRLNSWDRFAIPKPLSRVRMIIDDPLVVGPDLSESDLEHERLRLEAILRAGTDDAGPAVSTPTSDS
jgi:lysophospholipid acyltransferase (LPLAT)-like uncharacterized protein